MKEKKTRPVYNPLFRAALLVMPLMLRKYQFHTDTVPAMNEPFLMLANHTTESDFLMGAVAAACPVDFVCGEHLLRSKNGKLIKKFIDPITIPKGASSLSAVKEIVKRLKSGRNLLLFPEGSRSFNGETVPIHVSIGKLVRLSGAALVTYRIRGGYFIAPRWAYHMRTGPMEGHVCHVFSSAELRNMSAEEITDVINQDLYENAYTVQRENPHAYTSEGLAEGLENYLLLCPHCRSYDSMKTQGSHFRCEVCGMEGEYDEYGFLKGKDLPFDSVYDWGKWIEKEFDLDMQDRDDREPVFEESGIRLYRIDADAHTTEDVLTGSLKLYRDHLLLENLDFPFKDISEMSMLYFGKTLLFTCGKNYYGMTGPAFHAWKADRLYRLWRK